MTSFPSNEQKAKKVWLEKPECRLEWMERLIVKNKMDILEKIGTSDFPLDLSDPSVKESVNQMMDLFSTELYWKRLCKADKPAILENWKNASPQTFEDFTNNKLALNFSKALYFLIKNQAFEMFKFLIEEKVIIPENSFSYSGGTYLHTTASYGWFEATKFLLERGLDPNAKNTKNRTPLHQAAWSGTGQMAHLLLKHGAQVDAEDDYGKTPLISASLGNDGTYGNFSPPNLEFAMELVWAGADIYQHTGKTERSPLLLDKVTLDVKENLLIFKEHSELEKMLPEGNKKIKALRL